MKRPANTPGDLRKIDLRIESNQTAMETIFAHSEDVQFQTLVFGNSQYAHKVMLVYSPAMANLDNLHQGVLPSLYRYFSELRETPSAKHLAATLPVASAGIEQFHDAIVSRVFRGQLALFVDRVDVAFMVDLADPPRRQPDEPSNEMSIRGPKDGFVEELSTNVALVRKRLPTDSLCVEQFVIGVRSQTKIAVLFIRDVIDPTILSELKQRLENIHTDAIYASSQLEDFLTESRNKLVPNFSYSGRADFTAGSLLRGRFAIVVDGTPTVILGPVNLAFLFQSAEDEYTLYAFLILQRMLRFFGSVISLILPGLYVAIVSYHIDRIPLTLLGTFVTARHGVPFPTPVEVILILVLFEMLREAGNRLPGGLGQTLAVVGGLIIGEAAIDAGLTSPTVLVVTGTTAVASFTLSNQALAGAFAIFRIFILLCASILGEIGFLIGAFAVLTYLSTVRSFGVPYLSPISPLRTPDLIPAINSAGTQSPRKRPAILRTKDRTRG